MITKVVISAAGQGTRMLELSKNTSKHLIKVKDKPFLAYLLENVYQAGYKEIILVVGFKGELIKQFADDFAKNKPGLNIQIISQFEILGPKEKEYGTACPIKCAKNLVGAENFISLAGDNFYTVEQLKAVNIDDAFSYVAGVKHEHPEQFGVLVEEYGYLKEIKEKPQEFVSNLINISLYKFTPEIFETISKIKKSSRGEYEITDAISLLAKEKKVKIKKMKDFWMDFGRPEDIEKFSKFLQSK